MPDTSSLETKLAAIRAALYQQQPRDNQPPPVPVTPFVTISRQAGAGGLTLAAALAERLNRRDGPSEPWAVWDRQLVEKVAQREQISEALIESIEGPSRSWLAELIEGFRPLDNQRYLDEYQVYRRVAHTIRGLARAGRAIIVGRGGIYATRDLRGGVHIRLIAPLEFRIAQIARQQSLSQKDAADWVQRTDQARQTFHKRYWPDKALLPEIFTITLNTAAIAEEALADCIAPAVPR